MRLGFLFEIVSYGKLKKINFENLSLPFDKMDLKKLNSKNSKLMFLMHLFRQIVVFFNPVLKGIFH